MNLRIDECIVALTTNCTNIRSLVLTNTRGWTDNGISHISSLKNLRIFEIADSTVTNLSFLQYCSQLEQLDLRQCRLLNDESFDGIPQNCFKIRSLFLSGQKELTDKTMSNILRHCTALRNLIINSCENITDESIRILLTIPTVLEFLRIRNCPNVSAPLLAQLSKHPNIQLFDGPEECCP
jgi:F-box/leucine-rich repeat protein 2/20